MQRTLVLTLATLAAACLAPTERLDGTVDGGRAETGPGPDSGREAGPDGNLEGGRDAMADADCDHPTAWYPDQDGDGDGDPNPDTVVTACEAPDGHVDNPDDPQPLCERGRGAGCQVDALKCIAKSGTHVRQRCVVDDPTTGCTTWQDDPCPADSALCDLDTADCGSCAASTDCAYAHSETTPVCDPFEGECVVCGQGETQACGDKACNALTHTCSQYAPGSREVCEGCDADEACMGDMFCVELAYGDAPRGAYCLAERQGSCDQPYLTVLPGRDSLSDTAKRDICGINEALTTCEAVLALENNVTCTEDSQCPDAGLCRLVGAASGRCTYECEGPEQCPAAPASRSTCSNEFNANAGPEYCGGEDPP